MTSGALYTGNLLDLQVNGSSNLRVTEAGTLIGPASGTLSIDGGNAAAINIGGATATILNLGAPARPRRCWAMSPSPAPSE